jgi:hypothetical protein
MKKVFVVSAIISFGFSVLVNAETYLEDKDGKYLGKLGGSQYDPDSTSNPYGRYGSKYSADSINNPYGKYGSEYSNESPNNPYATEQPRIKNR